jgi:hypothetical protein
MVSKSVNVGDLQITQLSSRPMVGLLNHLPVRPTDGVNLPLGNALGLIGF